MSLNANDLPSYSDADILKIYRWALVNGAAGETRSINGRSVTFPAADKIMDIISQMELRIAAAGGNIAYGIIGDCPRGPALGQPTGPRYFG